MNNRNRFNNKHVLITGAARGIGFTIAQQFALEGAYLTIFDCHKDNLDSAVGQLEREGAAVSGIVVDVSKRMEVLKAVEKTENKAPVDILINNAGIAKETSFLEIEEEEWKKILDINLSGMFYVSQSVCKYMVKRGRGVVINMSSKNGLDGEAGYAHYNSSKGGIIMLTKTMALELASRGIRVNAVCPGYIQTPMSMEIDPPEFTQKFVDRYIPLNRPGQMTDIAPMFLFLASEESGFITGQTFVIDGGQLAGQKPF